VPGAVGFWKGEIPKTLPALNSVDQCCLSSNSIYQYVFHGHNITGQPTKCGYLMAFLSRGPSWFFLIRLPYIPGQNPPKKTGKSPQKSPVFTMGRAYQSVTKGKKINWGPFVITLENKNPWWHREDISGPEPPAGVAWTNFFRARLLVPRNTNKTSLLYAHSQLTRGTPQHTPPVANFVLDGRGQKWWWKMWNTGWRHNAPKKTKDKNPPIGGWMGCFLLFTPTPFSAATNRGQEFKFFNKGRKNWFQGAAGPKKTFYEHGVQWLCLRLCQKNSPAPQRTHNSIQRGFGIW